MTVILQRSVHWTVTSAPYASAPTWPCNAMSKTSWSTSVWDATCPTVPCGTVTAPHCTLKYVLTLHVGLTADAGFCEEQIGDINLRRGGPSRGTSTIYCLVASLMVVRQNTMLTRDSRGWLNPNLTTSLVASWPLRQTTLHIWQQNILSKVFTTDHGYNSFTGAIHWLQESHKEYSTLEGAALHTAGPQQGRTCTLGNAYQ